jgi:leader peptidase (prepilin peptidase)/N-methyltransferase
VPGPADLDAAHAAVWAYYLCFVAMLVGQTYIDIRHYIVPDEFSIYAIPVGVLGALGARALGATAVPTWQESVVGALIGGSLLAAVAGVYWLVRREEGMGLGDVKLLAMIGSFLGTLPALPLVLMVASATGAAVGLVLLAVRRRGLRSAVPFGPFLAFGAIVHLLHGEALLRGLFPGFEVVFGG